MKMIPFEVSEILRLALALAAGGIIGFDRCAKGFDAGFRTHIIVCVSSCAIMLANLHLFATLGAGDPTRMPAQVISGVGFLGAGCILVTSQRRIKGVTTAAGLWAAACLGLVIGAGDYPVAIIAVMVVYLSLTIFRYVDEQVIRKKKRHRYYVDLDSSRALSRFMEFLKGRGIKVTDLEVLSQKNGEGVVVTLTLRLKQPCLAQNLLPEFEKQEGVVYITDL